MVSEEKQVVIDAVIERLKEDFKQGDFTVLDELLGFVPIKNLIQSLPEEEWSKYSKDDPFYAEIWNSLTNALSNK